MKLRLEFIKTAPPLARLLLPGLLVWGLCIGLLWQWFLAQDRLADARQQYLTLENQRKKIHADRLAAARPDPVAQEKLKNGQQIGAALRYPWDRVLAELEQADMPELALLSFQYAQCGNGGELIVEAREAATLNLYVQRLNGETEVGIAPRWFLASYQLQAQATLPTVRGSIRRLRDSMQCESERG